MAGASANNNGIMKRAISSFTTAFLTLAFASAAHAAPIAATAVEVKGAVTATDPRGVIRPLATGGSLREGDRIVTGKGASTEIEFDGGDRVRLGESSDMTIKSLARENSQSTSIFSLAVGKARSLVTGLTKGSKFEYQTRTAICGVAGTDFVVEADDAGKTLVYVMPDSSAYEGAEPGADVCSNSANWGDGVAYVRSAGGGETVFVQSCFWSEVSPGLAPTKPITVPDDMLFGAGRGLPFLMLPQRSSQKTMLENIERNVSLPLKSADSVGPSLQKLDTHYDQGSGASSTGGGSGSAPPAPPLVHGTITINIGK